MNHQQKLKNIYNLSFSIFDIKGIPEKYLKYVSTIGESASQQKGVYTVLVTLLTHKLLFPQQDIRKHQSSMVGGFSGRTIDTQFITPTLKELGMPSMAESGWLTRSLEQPHPYTLDYPGKISNKAVKKAFLNILEYVQNEPERAEDLLRILLNKVIEVQQQSRVDITQLANPETLNILAVTSCLEEYFFAKYEGRGAAKLPVLAIYALYKSLINEVKRYEKCTLETLGSHTASDLTSKSAGDIEILDEHDQIFEALEVKHNKVIDLTIVRVAYEKIKKFNPHRYYILTTCSQNIKDSEIERINQMVIEIRREHGCQIIINGVIPTIKYYLRLITLLTFVNNFSNLISTDIELQSVHKLKWLELIKKHLTN